MQAVHDKSEVSIGEYLAVLRRRWIWIVATIVVLVGFVVVRDLRAAPVYRAQVQMLLQAKASENIFVPSAQVPSERTVQNELRVINSRVVRTAAAEAYGAPIAVEAIAGGDDDIIILRATDTDPEEAARKANVYAETYQTARLDALVEDLTSARDVIQQQVDDFQAQIMELNEPLAAIDAEIVETPVDDPRLASLQAQRSAEEARTEPRRQELEEQLGEYQQRLQLLQLSERLTTTGGVQILNPARVPGSPISPTIVRNVVQTLLVAAFLGVGLAFLRDQLDDSVRTQGDLDRIARDVPNLGLIPVDTDWRQVNQARLSTVDDPTSAVSEAFRALRTSLQYLALEHPMKVVLVTSANAGEGKTSALANLAIAYARAGKRVAVVGADLRRPRIHRFFEVEADVGLTSVLLGDVELGDALQRSPVHQNIDILPSGPKPPNPSELLSLDRTHAVVRRLTEDHAIVFIDTPPVLPVTDALVLSRCADSVLFLASAQRTSKREARRAFDMLRQIDSPMVGTVLNGVEAEDTYGSLYRYYGTDKPGLLDRLLRRRGADDGPFGDPDSLPVEPEISTNGSDSHTSRAEVRG